MILFALKVSFIASIINLILKTLLPMIMKYNIVKKNVKKPKNIFGGFIYDIFINQKKNIIQIFIFTFSIILVTILVCPPSCEASSFIK